MGQGKEECRRQKSRPSPQEHGGRGGGGGDSAVFLQKIEAKTAALPVESRTQQKSFLFLLEEKIRRAQIRKSEENFFAGLRVVASGGGLASLVPFKESSSKVYNYSTNTKKGDKKESRFLVLVLTY